MDEKPAAAEWARKLADRIKLLQDLDVADQCTDLEEPNVCGVEWATESNGLVCKYVLAPGLEWVKENDLGRGEYYEGAVSVVELQVARAGVRLAAWINAIAAATVDQEGAKEELR